MHVAASELAPVNELDAEFESRLATAHELALIEAEKGIEGLETWNAGLANADGADLVRSNAADVCAGIRERLGECGSGHPAGGAAAQDDYLFDGFTQARPPFGYRSMPKID